MKTYLICALLAAFSGYAQISGCTDPQSSNYNPSATINDGSCLYSPASVYPVSTKPLSDAVFETSGLVTWDGSLLTHNDNSDPALYQIDKSNAGISATINIDGLQLQDWEEIARDEEYLYLGDFGNNVSGIRTNLRIYKIRFDSLADETPVWETIWFSYQDQADFNAVDANKTDFDCEAFIVKDGFIYLFTKQWTSRRTSLYRIPNIPGTHVAEHKGSLDVGGLITGATHIDDKKVIVLSGYTTLLQPFVYLLYDFAGEEFFSGNKRKIGVQMPFRQVEAITTEDGLEYFITNEKSQIGAMAVPAALHKLNLSAYLENYLNGLSSLAAPEVKRDSYDVIYQPLRKEISIHPTDGTWDYAIADMSGRVVASGRLSGMTIIDAAAMNTGVYIVNVSGRTRKIVVY